MKYIIRLISLVLALCLLCGFIPVQTQAATVLPDEVFVTQIGYHTCTLCSAAMMLRARMYLSGNSDWDQITEPGIRSVAWLEGAGLRWTFTYTINGSSMTVNHKALSGISIEGLKAVLDKYPEGVVLHCNSLPHAVLVTDYEGDTFYCAETVKGYSEKRITLADSWMGKQYGSQASVLSHATSYWYVASYSIEGNGILKTLTMQFDANGGDVSGSNTYKVTTNGTTLQLRQSPGLGKTVLGQIPDGTLLQIGDTAVADGYTWAKVTYNGITGWCAISNGLAARQGYYLEDGILYASSDSKAYTQRWYYGSGSATGLAGQEALGLYREGYSFAGWSLSADGSTGVFNANDPALKAEDIAPEVAEGNLQVTLYAQWKPVDYQLSGAIDSVENGAKVNLELIRDGITVRTLQVTGDYVIDGLDAGDYTLRLSKAYHTTREYSVTVSGTDVKLDAKICMIGDISGDNKVNIKDWSMISDHIYEVNSVEEYQWKCADVNGDGKVNLKDWSRLIDHISEVNPLW